MAVLSKRISTSLQMKVIDGSDENGSDVVRTETYRNVKTDAENEDIFAVAQTIGNLMSTPVKSVIRVDNLELSSEEE